jgi:hypothetical protein
VPTLTGRQQYWQQCSSKCTWSTSGRHQLSMQLCEALRADRAIQNGRGFGGSAPAAARMHMVDLIQLRRRGAVRRPRQQRIQFCGRGRCAAMHVHPAACLRRLMASLFVFTEFTLHLIGRW